MWQRSWLHLSTVLGCGCGQSQYHLEPLRGCGLGDGDLDQGKLPAAVEVSVSPVFLSQLGWGAEAEETAVDYL